MAAQTFAEAVREHHHGLEGFMARDTELLQRLLSHSDDTTLANPFGGIARGWAEAVDRMNRAAANYADGEVLGIETISALASDDLGYTVEVERLRGRVGSRTEAETVTLRVTAVFRREADGWHLLHRHADPAVGLQAAESIVT
jgi:ketosteroid isomerase-like protein